MIKEIENMNQQPYQLISIYHYFRCNEKSFLLHLYIFKLKEKGLINPSINLRVNLTIKCHKIPWIKSAIS